MPLIYLLLASFLLNSCSHTKRPTNHQNQKNNRSPFFYKIQRNHKISYILGTVHYGVSLEEVSKRIPRILKKTHTHFYETLYSSKKAQYFFAVPKNPLYLYRSGLFRTAKAQGEKALGPQAIERIVHWGVPRPIAEAMSDRDCDLIYYRKSIFSGKSMDFEAVELSRKWKKKIVVLDSSEIRQKAKSLDEASGMDYSCSIQNDILDKPKGLKEMDTYLDGLVVDYKRGKASSFTDLTDGIRYRNQLWLKQVLPALAKGSSFITVGAYHLHGPYGLLKSLKSQGFEIIQMQ